jgi:flagellar protein FliL
MGKAFQLHSYGCMPENNTKTAETPKKKSNHTIVIAVVLVALAAGGLGAWRFLPRSSAQADSKADKTDDGTPRKKSTTKPKVKSVIHLESFVVNLTGLDETGYLRVGIDLGCEGGQSSGEDEKKKDDGATAMIRDTVLTVLGRSKASELLTPEGKEKLKKDLVEALDQRVPDLGVLEIYFTEFIVQR